MAALTPRIVVLLALAPSLGAHAISVSVGEATLEDRTISLRVRIPRYEAEHLTRSGDGAEKVAAAFRFAEASIVSRSCALNGEEFLCQLQYAFQAAPPESLAAEVTLARVTVPNHMHILRCKRGSVERQSIFDRTFEKDVIDFRQPSRLAVWSQGMRLGAFQVAVQPALLVLLFTIALLRAPWTYLAVLGPAFLIILPDRFYATPAFFELATGMAIAYLALEARFFPDAALRWLPLALVGAVEGAALAVLARPTGSSAVAYASGNLLAQAAVMALGIAVARFWAPIRRPGTFVLLAALGLLETAWIFVNRF